MEQFVYIMEHLPDLVKSALSLACESGKSLSWKVQESAKGTLIQLVWRSEPDKVLTNGKAVGFNWNHAASCSKPDPEQRKKRIPPSRARRKKRRLQTFLERKQLQ